MKLTHTHTHTHAHAHTHTHTHFTDLSLLKVPVVQDLCRDVHQVIPMTQLTVVATIVFTQSWLNTIRNCRDITQARGLCS